jgi:hypothetical protein
MKKLFELLRFKIGMWIALSGNKSMIKIANEFDDNVKSIRCLHCGKNPFFKD